MALPQFPMEIPALEFLVAARAPVIIQARTGTSSADRWRCRDSFAVNSSIGIRVAPTSIQHERSAVFRAARMAVRRRARHCAAPVARGPRLHIPFGFVTIGRGGKSAEIYHDTRSVWI